jgi:hypothetical protein
MRITRAVESDFTPGRWLCDLGCGHQQWVVSATRPDEATCSRCPRDERQEARAAAVNSGSGQGETAETAAFKERWAVELHCRVCSAKFELERSGMHVSLQQSAPFTRLVLLAVPEVCPECKSLRSVEASP